VRSFHFIAVSLIVISGLAGCKKSTGKNFNEGEIHYSISYIGRNSSISEALLPEMMVVKFKDNKIIMEIMSPIGSNGIFNIIKPEQKSIETYMRLLGMKFCYMGEYGEIPPGIDPMEDLIIEETGEMKELFGLNCMKAKAELPGEGYNYDLWYTSEIGINNPNFSTPYSALDGVLISFFYRMGDMIVEFNAEGVYIKTVPDKDFIIEENYRKIDRKDMDSIISKMMNL
jgi:hypothetical protein